MTNETNPLIALMNDTLDALAARMIDDRAAMRANRFSDDDTDYFPARAETCYNLTFLLTQYPHDLDADDLLAALRTDDFLIAYRTCDLDLPLDETLHEFLA